MERRQILLGQRGPFVLIMILLLGATALAPLTSADEPDEEQQPAPASRPTKEEHCPNLSDPLRRIYHAADWPAAAAMAGVPVVDDRVRVIVEIVADTEVPSDLPGLVEGQYLQYLQVLVQPHELCALAGHPGVVAVTAPFRSFPAGAGERQVFPVGQSS